MCANMRGLDKLFLIALFSILWTSLGENCCLYYLPFLCDDISRLDSKNKWENKQS
jgi:hypothetical protein